MINFYFYKKYIHEKNYYTSCYLIQFFGGCKKENKIDSINQIAKDYKLIFHNVESLDEKNYIRFKDAEELRNFLEIISSTEEIASNNVKIKESNISAQNGNIRINDDPCHTNGSFLVNISTTFYNNMPVIPLIHPTLNVYFQYNYSNGSSNVINNSVNSTVTGGLFNYTTWEQGTVASSSGVNGSNINIIIQGTQNYNLFLDGLGTIYTGDALININYNPCTGGSNVRVYRQHTSVD